MASRKNNPKSDAASWVLIAVLFLVGLWPIALAVLLFKLFGKDGRSGGCRRLLSSRNRLEAFPHR